jgi:hypothetical protein
MGHTCLIQFVAYNAQYTPFGQRSDRAIDAGELVTDRAASAVEQFECGGARVTTDAGAF